MSMLNHTNVKGKPMRIMWCERNPITRKTGKANLFVKNLDSSIDSARLDSIFSKFGIVLSCKVAEDENGKSKGFGFVQFDQEESTTKALNSPHDTLLEGKKLYVSNFIKRNQRNQTFTNLYVKNLKKDVSEAELKEKFSEYGKVNSAAIMRDDLGISKGYGFVSFESPEDAKKAMEALNGTSELACDSLFVGRDQKKAEQERMMKENQAEMKACSVHVTALGPNVDEGMLKSHFSVFGKVVQAKVMRYPNIISAWVTFSCPSEAKAAASSLFGLSSIHKPLYGAKVQCMEGERNYPLSVKHYYPTDSTAGKIVNLSSSFKKDEGLNFLPANGNANANANANDSLFVGRTQKRTERERRMISLSSLLHISKPKYFAVLDNGEEPVNNQHQESVGSINNVGNAVMVDLGAGGGQEGQNEHLPPPINIPQNIPQPQPQPRPLVRIVSSISFEYQNQNLNTCAILGVIFADDLLSWEALGARIRRIYERVADRTDVAMNYPGFWPGRALSYHCMVDNQAIERFPETDDWVGQNIAQTLTRVILSIPLGRQCQILIGVQLIGQLFVPQIVDWFHLATEISQMYLNYIGNAAFNIQEPLNPCNCCPGALVYYFTDLCEPIYWTECYNLTQPHIGDNWSWVQQVLYKVRINPLLG